MKSGLPQRSDDDETSPRLVILLGAGASSLADVPLTARFVVTLREAINRLDRQPGASRALTPHYDVLLAFLSDEIPSSPDIEAVYESLVRLSEADDDRFLRGRTDLPFGPDVAKLLKRVAEEHIRDKAFVEPPAVEYLDELVGLRDGGPLEVFTTNYDTCVEALCERHRLRWEDGFRVHWEPATFRRRDVDVRLHKLHGSVLWYRDAQGGYFRSVLRPAPGIPAWFGGPWEPLLIYPTRKTAQDAPYAHGLLRLAKLLGDHRRQVQLLVIGYSFRAADENIRQVVFDAARSNPGLSVVLVDPVATEIYRKSLSAWGDAPSPLAGRVLPVNEGLDRRGEVLRDLVRFRLGENASAVREELTVSRARHRRADDFRDVAYKHALAGDRHGYLRCHAARVAREEIPASERVRHEAQKVCLSLAGKEPADVVASDVANLCLCLRQSLADVVTIKAVGDAPNSSVVLRLVVGKADMRSAIASGADLARMTKDRSVGPVRQSMAAFQEWAMWLKGCWDRLPEPIHEMTHVSFQALLDMGILHRFPERAELNDPKALSVTVNGQIDRFFAEEAPRKLLDSLKPSPAPEELGRGAPAH